MNALAMDPKETREFARVLVAKGSPEILYDIAESFPIGDPAREACMKMAAILSRRPRPLTRTVT